MEQLISIGSPIATALFVIVAYELVRIPSIKKQFEKLGRLVETTKRPDVVKDALSEFKVSSEMEAAKALEYQKGLADGEKSALSKFEVKIAPFSKIKEDWLDLKVESGYQMQIHYSGFPIGDPTIRVTHIEQKVDKKEIEKYVDKVVGFITDLGLSYQTAGLKSEVSPIDRKKVKKI